MTLFACRRALFDVAIVVLMTAELSAGVLQFRVRDTATGYALSANVKYARVEDGWGNPTSAYTDAVGRFNRNLPDGHYMIEISAPGYGTGRTHSSVADDSSAGKHTIWLSPVTPPLEVSDERIEAQLRPDRFLIYGYVLDAETFEPLPGVRVHSSSGDVSAVSNRQGFVSVSVPMTSRLPEGEYEMTDLTYELRGYGRVVNRNTLVLPGDAGAIRIELVPGGPPVDRDLTHKLLRKGPTAAPLSEPAVEPKSAPGRLPEALRRWLSAPAAALTFPSSEDFGGAEASQQATALVAVPGTIRVGLNCPTKFTCADVETFPLEQYVTEGLGEEWIPSWHDNSLRAGSVAYRSYGAWYTNDPVASNYDICSTRSCQAFAPGQWEPNPHAKRVKDAVADTAGVVLVTQTTSGPEIMFAEYAAHNNAAEYENPTPCPDGFVGNTSFDWSCMPDPICTGDLGNVAGSHGRGMCQYGSQRWATGKNVGGQQVTTPKDWTCILDHYYNDLGNSGGYGVNFRAGIMQGATGGKIAFNDKVGQESYIYTVNTDGTQRTKLPAKGLRPSWEIGGSRIVYTSGEGVGLAVMNSDGSNAITLVPGDRAKWANSSGEIAYLGYNPTNNIRSIQASGLGDRQVVPGVVDLNSTPAFSPDGQRIAYSLTVGPLIQTHLFVANADGSGAVQLTFDTTGLMYEISYEPNWSPDGQTIAFSSNVSEDAFEIWTISASGGSPTQVTFSPENTHNITPSWTQDGHRIVFASNRDWYPQPENDLYVVDRDGGNVQRITGIGIAPPQAHPEVSRCGVLTMLP